ncbi:MAG: inositol monophosphatase [Verrucomicrobiae bacterium]|jgi:myo-inositol-1(or 4)-monophosphatase|nr:inositol monophosphatase [Verrucomicrobiae bacterium]
MNSTQLRKALLVATEAARAAGAMMRANLRKPKHVNESTQHDIKLELDVRCQKRIQTSLQKAYPTIPILGEEGILGDPNAEFRWVVDPIDGTVNFAYDIPHACVCIALQQRRAGRPKAGDLYGAETILGVTYDPFLDELWTATRDQKSRCNGRPIQVSKRAKLAEAIITMGFSKKSESISKALPTFTGLIPKVRKVRMFGSAGLSMAWIAAGRLDAYLEAGVRIWDVAAGSILIRQAGGEFWHSEVAGDYAVEMISSNGLLRRKLRAA